MGVAAGAAGAEVLGDTMDAEVVVVETGTAVVATGVVVTTGVVVGTGTVVVTTGTVVVAPSPNAPRP